MSVSTTARITLATALASLSLGATAAVAADATPADATASVELGAGGQLIDSYDCAWNGVPDTDRCLLVVQDGPDQVAFLKRVGADHAAWTTQVPGRDVNLQATLAQRADGTWLFQGTSAMGAKTLTYGFVSDADGHNWVRYEVSPRASSASVVRAKSAKKAVARATVRLQARR